MAGFSARVACSAGDKVLTQSGVLLDVASQNVSAIDPRPQFMEFALSKLREISDESSALRRSLVSSESALANLQLIHAIGSRRPACDAALSICSKLGPDGRIFTTLSVTVTPLAGFACRGISIGIAIQSNSFATETINFPVATQSVLWSHDVAVVSPQPLTVDLIFLHRENAVSVSSAVFDLMDFSVSVDPIDVEIGRPGIIHSCLGAKPPFSIAFKVSGGKSDARAFLAPTGEAWTVRVDGKSCMVTAATEAIAIAAMAAVLRRQGGDGQVDVDSLDPRCIGVQRQAEELAKALEHDMPLMRGNLVQKSRELHCSMQNWIDSLL
jgi:hypothetical protein